MKTLKKTIASLGLAAMLALPVLAADQIILRDGRVLSGEILEQTENYVKIRITVGTASKVEVVFAGDIREIKRDASGEQTGQPVREGGSTEAGPAVSGSVSIEPQKPNVSPNNPGVLVLPLSGMVGVEFRAADIRKAGEEADRIFEETGRSPIIVLHIESGGGLLLETYTIHDTIKEIKSRHRVVAWVKEAISAACATAMSCDEIYFMSEGNAGAMTAYAGTTALTGPEREAWLRRAGEWAESGGRSKYIAWAMIGNEFELSYDKDPVTGEVTWYNDLRGEYKLSGRNQNLSFDKTSAVHSGFADGWADTPEQLARVMQLPEWYEVSNFGRKLHREWIATIERGRHEIPRAMGSISVIQNSTLPETTRIGQMISEIQRLIRWWDLAPELCTYEIPIPPKEELERTIRQLRERLAEIRRQERERMRGGG